MSHNPSIEYSIELSDNTNDIEEILHLHRENHISALKESVLQENGFVTLELESSMLAAMSGPYKHVIAKSGGKLIGYALVFLKEPAQQVPLLEPFFASLESASYKKKLLKDWRYFVMGQICVQRNYRGRGVFSALYEELKRQMSNDFDLIVTEVSINNKISSAAHQKIGFREIQLSEVDPSAEWTLIAWDWH